MWSVDVSTDRSVSTDNVVICDDSLERCRAAVGRKGKWCVCDFFLFLHDGNLEE